MEGTVHDAAGRADKEQVLFKLAEDPQAVHAKDEVRAWLAHPLCGGWGRLGMRGAAAAGASSRVRYGVLNSFRPNSPSLASSWTEHLSIVP